MRLVRRRRWRARTNVDEGKVNDERRRRRRREELREPAERQCDRGVCLEPFVQMREEADDLLLDGGRGRGEEAEDVDERRVEQRRQLRVVAHPDTQLRCIELRKHGRIAHHCHDGHTKTRGHTNTWPLEHVASQPCSPLVHPLTL